MRRSHTRKIQLLALLLATAVGFLAGGCRPDSVTSARDRLSDDEARTVSYRLPLAREEYGALDFLRNTATEILRDGLVAVPVLPDSVRVLVGSDLLDDGRAELEAVEPVDPGSLNLDELAPAVRASEVRRAPIQLTVRHTSSATLTLVEPALALVRTDASGEPRRDASGELDLESDTSGEPLTVPLGDTLEVAPGERLDLERDGAGLVDRMAELLVAGEPVAVVLTGATEVSDSERPLVAPEDVLVLGHRALVGLDLVLPDSGVVVRREELGDGFGFSERDADQVQERVLRAGARLVATNEIPFAVRVDVAYAAGDLVGRDVFGAEDRVVLDSLAVPGGGGDGQAAVDTVRIDVSGAELRPLLEDVFTAGVRIRLLPGPGPDPGGALRVGELVDVDARVFLDVRAGGGS